MLTIAALLLDAKVHYGGMRYADPHPFIYPTITVKPADRRLVTVVTTPEHEREAP